MPACRDCGNPTLVNLLTSDGICGRCMSQRSQPVQNPGLVQQRSVGGGLMMPPSTPRSYRDGDATVTYGGRDPEIFDDMARLVMAINVVADKMKKFSVQTERTRYLIKQLKMIAIEVETEIETRRGY